MRPSPLLAGLPAPRARQRIASQLLLLAACLCLGNAAAARNEDDYRDFSVIGKWRITAVLDFADISSFDDAQAKSMVGEVLAIGKTRVLVGTEVCPASEFWAERVVPELDLRERVHASARKLKLPNPATIVELSCTYVYVRDDDHLVLLWGGAFFDTVRIKSAATGQASAAKRRAGATVNKAAAR